MMMLVVVMMMMIRMGWCRAEGSQSSSELSHRPSHEDGVGGDDNDDAGYDDANSEDDDGAAGKCR